MMKFIRGATILVIGLTLSFAAYSAQASDEMTAYGTTLSHLKTLAAQGNGQAQFDLALLYHSGTGVTKSESEAVKLYIAAAENGSLMAQQFLVMAYQEGWFGLPQNLKRASYWSEQIQYYKGVSYN